MDGHDIGQLVGYPDGKTKHLKLGIKYGDIRKDCGIYVC
jgi:hypothetical protein